MKLTREELINRLSSYNADELFYRQYYDARKHRWKLEEFLSQQDTGEILKRQLFIPEIAGPLIPEQMADQDYFQIDSRTSVYISKHNRFTPAFTHRHIFYEIIYVLSGTCTQEFENETLTLSAGDFCLLAPGTSHATGVFNDSVVLNILIRRSTFDDIFYNLLREPNLISTFFNQTLYREQYQEHLIFQPGDDREIQNFILDMFLEQLHQEQYGGAILNSMLMILFLKILRCCGDTAILPAARRKHDGAATEMLSYIEDNYQSLTLSELAAHFHYSVSYCSRRIKELTGYSFCTILRKIRLQRAASMLGSTNLSVAEISRRIGFENPEHFCRVFKKAYGITPGSHRIQFTP